MDSDYRYCRNRQKYKRIFVTVGTTSFEELCESLYFENILHAFQNIGTKEVVVQVGNGRSRIGVYEDEGIQITTYRFKDSIEDDILWADLVISHAGAGSCLEVLEAKKPLLVVINQNLMDNHQIELAEQLQSDGHAFYTTCDSLAETLIATDFRLLVPLPSSEPKKFYEYLDQVFQVTDTNK